MRLRTSLLLILLALCAVAVPARAARPGGHLDRSFGQSGIARAVAPKADHGIEGFTVGADGRVYVLDGSLLFAFQSDGKVAGEFGEDGRVEVAPAAGGGDPIGLAVDSQGRLLVAGSIQGQVQRYFPSYTTYVIRILPDGSRDRSFGSDGELDTDFDLPGAEVESESPSVSATSIVVDARDRPVIGGSYGETAEPCGVNIGGGPAPFVARLTASGRIDKSFGNAGHMVLKGKGSVMSIAQIPAGGLAVFSRPCVTPPRVETQSPHFIDLTEDGNVNSPAVEGGLPFTWVSPTIDPSGRIVELESPPPAAVEYEPDALVRLLPNGNPDPGFGGRGKVVLRSPREVTAFAVDAEGRPIVASGEGLRRFLLDGKPDLGFGPDGRLTAKVGAPSAIAFGAGGRIYTAGVARNKSRTILKIARFTPGH